jgi:general secretion pathway protein D
MTVPNATYNFGKTLANSETLANPKIRVKNREKAKFNVGTRVPITTTSSPVGGGITTNVQYVDVGVKVNAEPTIQLSNDVSIKLSLEVSAIINTETVGGTTAPTTVVTIGTRNLDTVLSLKNGETSIIGGLIQDSKSTSKQKISIIGDIPVIGPFLTNNSDDDNKTELILAITPRLVRGITVPPPDEALFWSGKEDEPSVTRVYSSFEETEEETAPAAAPGTGVQGTETVPPVPGRTSRSRERVPFPAPAAPAVLGPEGAPQKPVQTGVPVSRPMPAQTPARETVSAPAAAPAPMATPAPSPAPSAVSPPAAVPAQSATPAPSATLATAATPGPVVPAPVAVPAPAVVPVPAPTSAPVAAVPAPVAVPSSTGTPVLPMPAPKDSTLQTPAGGQTVVSSAPPVPAQTPQSAVAATSAAQSAAPAASAPQQGKVASPAPAEPTKASLKFVAPPSVKAGEQFNVEVQVADVSNLAASPFIWGYDQNLVEFVNIAEGGFLKQNGNPTHFQATDNSKSGQITVLLDNKGRKEGVNGTGTLAIATFKALKQGQAKFKFNVIFFTAPGGKPVKVISSDAVVEVK